MAIVSKTTRCAVCGSTDVTFSEATKRYHCASCGADEAHAMNAADVAAIGIYVWLISIDLGGSRWFRGLALPMIGWAGVLVFLLSFLLRGGRRSTLSAIALAIGAAGLLAIGIEFCIDRYFRGVWQPGWSLIVLAVCVGLIIPLRIVRRVPSLRGEARRPLHLSF